MIETVVLKTVRYTEDMSNKAREVVDKFNEYAENTSGALEDHLCLVPLSDGTLEDLIDDGSYEYTSKNPHFEELKKVLDELWAISRPYHNIRWEDDILEVINC